MKNFESSTLRRALLLGITCVALVGALVFLFDRTRSLDIEGHQAVVAVLRQLKQVDAQWTTEALRSRAMLESGDALPPAAPLLASLKARLTAHGGAAWPDDAARERLGPLAADVASTIERKLALAQRLKEQGARVRAAARDLQASSSELADAARTRVADRRLAADVQQAAAALVADTTTYLLLSDGSMRARIEQREAALSVLLPLLPADLSDLGERARLPVQTVLQEQKSVDELLAQMAALPAAKKLDDLIEACSREQTRLLAEQQQWTLVLVGYCALLVVLFSAVGMRLVTSEGRVATRGAAIVRARTTLHGARAALAQSGKMSSLGEMAAGIFEEIDAPLARVRGTLAVLRDHMARVDQFARRTHAFTGLLAAKDKDQPALAREFAEVQRLANDAVASAGVEEMTRVLDDTAAGIEQVSEVLTNVKNYTRPQRGRVPSYDVREGLERSLLLARNLIRDRVHVVREFGAVRPIDCIPAQVNQVLLTLIRHAVQAIPPERDGFLTLRTEMDDDKTVRIEIQDNGGGIAADVLPRIFEPASQATDAGRAGGIGLATSYRIVKQHGGAILVDTEIDVGTVFTILLPVEPPADAVLAPDPAAVVADAAPAD